MEASPGAEKTPEPKKETKKTGVAEKDLGTVGIVLAAIGGGIGVLGFVAFFGAAILWVQMDGAGLPANEAVAVVPKSVLLTTGAAFLVPALLIALGFTMGLYLVEWIREEMAKRGSKASGSGIGTLFATSHMKAAAKLEQQRGVAKAKQEAAEEAEQKLTEELERAKTLKSLLDDAEGSKVETQTVEKLEEAHRQAYVTLGELSLEANPETQKQEKGQEEGSETQKKESEDAGGPREVLTQEDLIREERTEKEALAAASVRSERWQGTTRVALMILAFGIGAYFSTHSVHLRPGRLVVLVAVAIGLTAVCVSVLSRTKSFAFFALAAFISAGVYSGVITYYRTVEESKVEPAAVLRTSGPPEYGFFVAQTTDRIYIGTTQPTGKWRMEAILREEVADMTVGPLEPTEEANEYGRTLAIEICKLAMQRAEKEKQLTAAQVGAPKKAQTPAEPCKQPDLELMQEESRAERAEQSEGST